MSSAKDADKPKEKLSPPPPPIIGHPDTLTNGGPGRVLLFVPHRYFYEDHYQIITDALKRRGTPFIVTSTVDGKLNPKHGKIKPVNVDLTLDRVDIDDFDALVFLGGNFWEFTHKNGETGNDVHRLINAAAEAKRVVAGVGDGWNAVTDSGLVNTCKQRKDRELYICTRADFEGSLVNVPDPALINTFVQVAFNDLLKR